MLFFLRNPKLNPKLTAWLFEGIYSGDEGRRHLVAIRNMQPRGDDVFEHDHLYECLSILDSKAIGLLTYDSLLIAATSLLLTLFSKNPSAGDILIFTALILGGLASALCLYVIWIFWTGTADFEDSSELFMCLLSIRNRRTVAYRVAWVMSQFAMFFLILGVLLERA